MKPRLPRAFFFAALALLPAHSAFSQGVTTSNLNPLQVAIKHWYGANLAAQFPVGAYPRGITFDGGNIWVSLQTSNAVLRIRPSDGAQIASYTVGVAPIALESDGASIWVANYSSNTVSRIIAATGVVKTYKAMGSGPAGLVFDGTYIWIADSLTNNVARLRASDGACVSPCIFTAGVGTNPANMAFDGSNVWISNTGSTSVYPPPRQRWCLCLTLQLLHHCSSGRPRFRWHLHLGFNLEQPAQVEDY